MTKTRFKKEIGKILKLKTRLDDAFDAMEIALGAITEGALYDTTYRALELSIDYLEELSADNRHWINWYLLERNETSTATINGQEMPCRNAGDLWEIIKAHNESEGE